jgi:hypothetical protein
MKCPRCKTECEVIRSGVDGRPIHYCPSVTCAYQTSFKEDASEWHSWNTSQTTSYFERLYNGAAPCALHQPQ